MNQEVIGMKKELSTSVKRRDSKGRILFDGEQQKKDGRYEFRYYDLSNKRRSIYSWRLTQSDPVPKGKQYCLPLRDMEQEIDRDKHDKIDTFAAKSATLNNRFDLYMDNKINLKPSTKQNYVYMYDRFVRDELGGRLISEINSTHIQEFYNELITQRGFKPNTIVNIHTLLNPVFERAVDDQIIRNNPCSVAMKEVRNMNEWTSKRYSTKPAFTVDEQINFVDFFRNDKKYKRWVNILIVLLGTGMRIGECTGLRWDDCDFIENTISVNHTLIYRKWEDGYCGYRVMSMPKTKNSIRKIPMLDAVREALLAEKQYQNERGTANTVIDGYSNWVFTNRFGCVCSPKSVNQAISRIIRDYNNEEKRKAELEGRTPIMIPHMTNHQMRHSFCTRMMEESIYHDNNIPVKIFQQIMGHADIETSMAIYTDISERLKQGTMEKVKGNIYLG